MDLNRGLSGLLALGYLVTAWGEAGAAAVWIVLPLAVLVGVIWHAEAAADFTGMLGLTPIRRPSPPGLVRALAWALLLVPLVGTLASLIRAGS